MHAQIEDKIGGFFLTQGLAGLEPVTVFHAPLRIRTFGSIWLAPRVFELQA